MNKPVEFPPSEATLAIWIGVFGKALVTKGILAPTDITSQLDKIKAEMLATDTPISRGTALEVEKMIQSVSKWAVK